MSYLYSYNSLQKCSKNRKHGVICHFFSSGNFSLADLFILQFQTIVPVHTDVASLEFLDTYICVPSFHGLGSVRQIQSFLQFLLEQPLIKISHKSDQICSLEHKCHKFAKIRLSHGEGFMKIVNCVKNMMEPSCWGTERGYCPFFMATFVSENGLCQVFIFIFICFPLNTIHDRLAELGGC